MSNKGILKRKIHRARKAYKKAVAECTTGYNGDILLADMRLKYYFHQYNKRYPRPLPKFSLVYNGSGF